MLRSWRVTAETLSGVRIFAMLDGEARAAVAGRCHGQRVAAGYAVVHNGDHSDDSQAAARSARCASPRATPAAAH